MATSSQVPSIAPPNDRALLLASSESATPSSPPISSYHYLTLPRSIIFQLTSILSAIDGALGSYTLYTMHTRVKMAAAYGATLDIGNAVLAGALLTAAGSLAGAACGLLFLIIVFKPGHRETSKTVLAKEVTCAFFSIFFLIASIVSTVIVATSSAKLYTPGLSSEVRQSIIENLNLSGTLQYRHSRPAIAFVVLGWVSWLFMTFSLVLVSKAGRHVHKHGPAVGAYKTFPERLAIKYGPRKVFGDEV